MPPRSKFWSDDPTLQVYLEFSFEDRVYNLLFSFLRGKVQQANGGFLPLCCVGCCFFLVAFHLTHKHHA